MQPQPAVWTAGSLTRYLARLLAADPRLGEVAVEGEVSRLTLAASGHAYFTLKDDSAQIRGVMFRSAGRALRFKPEDGLQVIAHGRLGVYEPKGEYQLVC